MVQINFARKEVSCKLVYYGPGMSGKTTNLQVIHQKAPQNAKGDLIAIATEGDRTLFFDFLPLDLGKVKGMNTKFQLYTVPGQVYYASTRKLVLQGADGVVFVADSQKKKLEDNLESLKDLENTLKEHGIDIKTFPLVIQWNKRDLPDAADVPWLEEKINLFKAPTVEAVAARGDGVMTTLKVTAKLILDRINERGGEISASTQTTAPAVQPARKEEPVVAVVNGAKITRNYFLDYCQVQYRLAAQGEVEDFHKLGKKELLELLNNLINHMLLMQEAKKSGIAIDKKQLEAQLIQMIRKFGSREKFDLWMESRLLKMDNMKNEAVKNIVVATMLKNLHPGLAEEIEPVAAEITAYYESHTAAFPAGPDESADKIRRILRNKKKRALMDSLYSALREKSKISVFEDKL